MNKKELIDMAKKEKDTWEWRVIEFKDYYSRGRYDGMVKMLRELENLDEPESKVKPIIARHVANYIELKKSNEYPWTLGAVYKELMEDKTLKDVYDWCWEDDINHNNFAMAYITGEYTVGEKELYARIKGHELIDTDIEMDEGDRTDPEWYRNIYFVIQSDGEIIIDMKDSGLDGTTHSMSEEDWNKIGINETNADFVGVD